MSGPETVDLTDEEVRREANRFWTIVRIAAIVALVILAVMVLAVIVSEVAATKSTESFTVDEPVDTVHIETVGGRVTVEAAGGDAIEVVRTSHYSIVEPDGAVGVDGMSLTLTDGCRRSILLIPNCTVDFELRVPRDTSLVIDGERTDVSITGVTGSINVTTTAADIEFTETGGPITVDVEGSDVESTELTGPGASIATTDGSILLDYVDPPDVIAATTTVGPVTVVAPQAPYAVEVSAANGDVVIGVIDDPTSERKINVTNSAGNVAILARP